MPRKYDAPFEDVAITAAQDLFEVLCPTTGTIKILEIHLMQSTDVGDASEEILELESIRGDGAVTSGSGGSSLTPEPHDNGDSSSAATVEANNTTRMVAGAGTLDLGKKYGWNIRVPFDLEFPPGREPILSAGDRWVFGLNDAPADSITVSGHITYEETGG